MNENTENIMKQIISLSDEVLREMKVSSLLTEDKENIRRLEDLKWKYRNKKYFYNIVSTDIQKSYRFINMITGKRIFLEKYKYKELPEIEIQNSKIKDYFSIRKELVDLSEEAIRCKMDENLEDILHYEIENDEKVNIEKYIVEKDFKFINKNQEYELIKNTVFSLTKLNYNNLKLMDNHDDKINIVDKISMKKIINSDVLIIILDEKDYLSKPNKILIENIFKNINKKYYSKIFFVIDMEDKVLDNAEIIANLKKYIQYLNVDIDMKYSFINIKKYEELKLLEGEEDFKSFIQSNYELELKEYLEYKFGGLSEVSIADGEIIEFILEKNGLSKFEDSIVKYMFENNKSIFLKEAFEKIENVLEGISFKVGSKINILNKNNSNLYEMTEDIKTEINKLELQNYDWKIIAENEFVDLESKIGNILSLFKKNIGIEIENILANEQFVSSYDLDSLGIIVGDMQKNVIKEIQFIVDKELEKIKMNCVESQYKIYIESQYKLSVESQKKLNTIARDKFNELLKEFTKSTAEDYKIFSNEFNVNSNTKGFSGVSKYTYSVYESGGIHKEYKFDIGSAIIGSTMFFIAGGTIGSLFGVMIDSIEIMQGILIGGIIGAISGFSLTSKKEVVREKEVRLYKLDIKMFKEDTLKIVDDIILNMKDYVTKNVRDFENKHMKFLENDMSKFLCCLGDDSNNIINSHKAEINDMIDLKFKVDGYVKDFKILKSKCSSFNIER